MEAQQGSVLRDWQSLDSFSGLSDHSVSVSSANEGGKELSVGRLHLPRVSFATS